MSFNSKPLALAIAISMLPFLPIAAWAHKDMHLNGPRTPPAVDANTRSIEQAISVDFQNSVKPIFEAKCIACHGQVATLPWYSSFPFAKNLIQRDLVQAKEHLDMSTGFPFGGHGSDMEDLEAIRESVDAGDMPPLRYKLLHWSARVSQEERSAIVAWVLRAETQLRSNRRTP